MGRTFGGTVRTHLSTQKRKGTDPDLVAHSMGSGNRIFHSV